MDKETSERVELVYSKLGKSHQVVKDGESDESICMKYAGLYYKKYTALRKIAQATGNKVLRAAMNHIEFLDCTKSADEALRETMEHVRNNAEKETLPESTRTAIIDRLFKSCQKGCSHELVREEHLIDEIEAIESETVPVPVELLRKISRNLVYEWSGGAIMLDELLKIHDNAEKRRKAQEARDAKWD